ncbi:MAG: DUF1289 domain-containing protein [Pseudomonadales bacterium]|nr:DUF1289 domain-containing protein [Pseudomonadales bacterium]MCP5183979.1 DUF1289 domain-containing protein [Pseudomonadales bacterium]
MKTLQRATPCVGICSTTYGDLVCRGCKRFSHEIVQWNSYSRAQQDVIWQRLFELRRQAVASAVRVVDAARFANMRAGKALPADVSWELAAYELLRGIASKDQPLSDFGLEAAHDEPVLTLLRGIDADIYNRSRAWYERSFRVAAD